MKTRCRWLLPGAAMLAAALVTSTTVDGGACCYPNGACVQETEISCRTFHGTYLGNGTLCFGTDCGCPGDFDSSGDISAQDVIFLLANWGGAGPTDLDGSGATNFPDLMLVIRSFGPCL